MLSQTFVDLSDKELLKCIKISISMTYEKLIKNKKK